MSEVPQFGGLLATQRGADAALSLFKVMFTERRATTVTAGLFSATVRALASLTFTLGTSVTLHASLEPFAESVNLEAVGEEELVAAGTLKGSLLVVHCLCLPVLVCIPLHPVSLIRDILTFCS